MKAKQALIIMSRYGLNAIIGLVEEIAQGKYLDISL